MLNCWVAAIDILEISFVCIFSYTEHLFCWLLKPANEPTNLIKDWTPQPVALFTVVNTGSGLKLLSLVDPLQKLTASEGWTKTLCTCGSFHLFCQITPKRAVSCLNRLAALLSYFWLTCVAGRSAPPFLYTIKWHSSVPEARICSEKLHYMSVFCI